MADQTMLHQALNAAEAARLPLQQLPAYKRHAILSHCIQRLMERSEELAMIVCQEVGKSITAARGEVQRMIETFRRAAEESLRVHGEIIPMDTTPQGTGYTGYTRRVPIGPCLFITPFNFPLNLVAHKIAPAIASGCPFILKPSTITPLSALLLGEILAETELPVGAFSILPCTNEDTSILINDERLKLFSFTGSGKVGWQLAYQATHKRCILELGGNAACIVHNDTDLQDAAKRIAFGAFNQAGQSCISVQRVLVHQSIYSAFKQHLIEATKILKTGDPKHPETTVGPMISEKEALRLHSWIQSAVTAGATITQGGTHQGALFMPTVMENVSPDQPLSCDEAFGPIVILSTYENFSDALAQVNNSRYGLQAGVFTRDLYRIQQAWDTLEVGGIVIEDVPTVRFEHMPYGGVKQSGNAREGVRFAMESMTDIRLLLVRIPHAP